MPTISRLPSADPVSASDLIPISQNGSVRSVAVGALLAQTQPAIIASSPSLLGRTSIGSGGPDVIAIGEGLTIRSGALVANNFDPNLLAIQTDIAPTNYIIVTDKNKTLRLAIGQLRGLFSPGPNIEIDGSGVISSSIASGSSGTYNLSTLPTVTSLGQQDVVPVSQGGKDHSISYSNFINGLTIDRAQSAGVASDSDTFWIAQNTNVMARQTLGMLWPWITGKMPLWKRRVVELAVSTTLDGTVHNNSIIICSASITISALAVNMGSGFSCELVNVSAGPVTLAGTIVVSNGTRVVAPNQCATIHCAAYSAGTVVIASLGAGSVPPISTLPPGQISNLTMISITSSAASLSWLAPTTGGSPLSYAVQFRISGTTTWISEARLSDGTTYTVSGLQSATNYEFSVIAINSYGNAPISSILSATTFSVASTPSAPSGLKVTNANANSVACSWNSSVAGGAGITYIVQYRVSASSQWNTAATNISTLSFTIIGLSPSTVYDIQIIATSPGGISPASAAVTATTTPVTANGAVTNIAWNLPPSGIFHIGSGAIGVNIHVTPATAPVEFGFSIFRHHSTNDLDSWAECEHKSLGRLHTDSGRNGHVVRLGRGNRWQFTDRIFCSIHGGLNMSVIMIAPGKVMAVGSGHVALWKPLIAEGGDGVLPVATGLASIPDLLGWWDASHFASGLDGAGQPIGAWHQATAFVKDRSTTAQPLAVYTSRPSSIQSAMIPRLAGTKGGIGASTRGTGVLTPALTPYHGLVYEGRSPSSGANWTWWIVWSRPNWRQGTNLDGQPGTILSVGSVPILQIDNKAGNGRLILFPGGANIVLNSAMTRRHTHSIILRNTVDGGVDIWLDGHLLIKGVQNGLPASPNDPLLLLHDGSAFGAAQCWFHEAATWGRGFV